MKFNAKFFHSIIHSFLFASIFFSQRVLLAKEVRILFTSSLNGNISGCQCSTHPISGLVKRYSWIDSYKKDHPDTLLLDTGDLVTSTTSVEAQRFIHETYKKQGYNAIVPGSSDLSASLPLLKMNLSGLPFVGNATVAAGITDYRIIQLQSIRIAVIGYTSHKTFQFSSVSTEDAGLKVEQNYIQNAVEKVKELRPDYTILLMHATTHEARQLTSIPGIDLLIVGYNQFLPQKLNDKKNNGKYFLQAGGDGEYIGEVILTYRRPRWMLQSERVIPLYKESHLTNDATIERWLHDHP